MRTSACIVAAASAVVLCAARAAAAAPLPECAHAADNFAAKLRLTAPDPLGLVSDGASGALGSPTAAVRVAEHFEVRDRAPARAQVPHAPAAGLTGRSAGSGLIAPSPRAIPAHS